MKTDMILRRSRAIFLAGLVALLMLFTALPASADVGPVVSDPTNITWEGSPSDSLLNITWE